MMIEVAGRNPVSQLPFGRSASLLHSTWGSSSAMKPTVRTPNAHVNQVWMVTMVACPSSPTAMVTAAI
jgi:hypothetical protein